MDKDTTSGTTPTGEAGNAPISGDKTFSQDDVNRIVSERLSREKAKLEGAVAEREQELSRRETKLLTRERLQERGLSLELADIIHADTPEDLDKHLDILEKNMKPQPFTLDGAKPASPAGVPGRGNPVPMQTPDNIRSAMGLNR